MGKIIDAMGRIATDGDTDCDDDFPTRVCAGDCGQSFDPMDMEECGECFALVCVACFPAHEATCGKQEVSR